MAVSPKIIHAASLCWIAGFVDAVGYFQYGRVFTANMTGNTVLMAAAIAHADEKAWLYASMLVMFSAGVVIAVLLKRAHEKPSVPLLAAAVLLLGLALTDPPGAVVTLSLAVAMGIQGGTLTTFEGVRLPTVVVTSTLVGLVEDVMGRVLRRPSVPVDRLAERGMQGRFATWAAYGIGAAVAVLLPPGLHVLLAPSVVYLLLAADLYRAPATA